MEVKITERRGSVFDDEELQTMTPARRNELIKTVQKSNLQFDRVLRLALVTINLIFAILCGGCGMLFQFDATYLWFIVFPQKFVGSLPFLAGFGNLLIGVFMSQNNYNHQMYFIYGIGVALIGTACGFMAYNIGFNIIFKYFQLQLRGLHHDIISYIIFFIILVLNILVVVGTYFAERFSYRQSQGLLFIKKPSQSDHKTGFQFQNE